MKNTEYRKAVARPPLVSAGFTLIELMVGMTIGLVVVMVAVYAIVTARKASGTVTDISAMKQQASYVMYVMGTQIRQMGSVDVFEDPVYTTVMPTFYFDAANLGHGFPRTGLSIWNSTEDFTPLTGTDGGTAVGQAGSDTLGISIIPSPVLVASQRDCLGNAFQPGAVDYKMRFTLENNQLMCEVAASTPNTGTVSALYFVMGKGALAQNVTDFQVKYRYRGGAAGVDGTTIVDAVGLGGGPVTLYPNVFTGGDLWDRVNAVEICFEMQGTESVPSLAGATYVNCRDETVQQGNRLTRVYRSLYTIRARA